MCLKVDLWEVVLLEAVFIMGEVVVQTAHVLLPRHDGEK
jgi:hypothetical protein